MMYQKCERGIILLGFSDVDWVGDHNTRRPTCGYRFLLASGSNAWACNKQTDVALCSSKSEYKVLSEAVTEAIWLCQERKETKKNVRVLIIGVKVRSFSFY